MSTIAIQPAPVSSGPVSNQAAVPSPSKTMSEFVLPAMPPASASVALSIAVTPVPETRVPLYENVAVWVAAVTLLGVYLNLREAGRRTKLELEASEKRLHVGLAHAANEAAIEREQTREQAVLDRQHSTEESHLERIATARRTIYLEAIGELVKAQSFLGGLAQQDLSRLDLPASLNGLLTSAARINILGEMATVSKSRELVTLINKLIYTGITKVAPLQIFIGQIATYQKLYTTTQTEIARILSAMTHHNETLKNDPRGFEALQKSFDIQRREADSHTENIATAETALMAGRRSYGLWILEEVKVLANCVDELATAVRVELGLETDLQKFQEMTAAMYEQAMKTVKGALDPQRGAE